MPFTRDLLNQNRVINISCSDFSKDSHKFTALIAYTKKLLLKTVIALISLSLSLKAHVARQYCVGADRPPLRLKPQTHQCGSKLILTEFVRFLSASICMHDI